MRFRGGERMERFFDQMERKLRRAKVVRMGYLEGATYPNGTPVPMVAAIQEFGAPARGIPPRPTFRPMIAEHRSGWSGILAGQLNACDYDAKIALGRLGAVMAGQLREKVTALVAPPLSPVTLMLRKMQYDDSSLIVTGKTVGIAARRVAAGEDYSDAPTKPLVFTGHMLQSIDFEVKGV